jgi:hypothetical protein
MIRDFESWNNLVEASQLEELRGARVGIEAADYLRQRILDHSRNKEPLVPALGGLPLGFVPHIEEDLRKFEAFDIKPFFVFSGLDIAKQDNVFQQRREGAANNASAWSSYDAHLADKAVRQFGESGKTWIRQRCIGQGTNCPQRTSLQRTSSADSSLFWPRTSSRSW